MTIRENCKKTIGMKIDRWTTEGPPQYVLLRSDNGFQMETVYRGSRKECLILLKAFWKIGYADMPKDFLGE